MVGFFMFHISFVICHAIQLSGTTDHNISLQNNAQIFQAAAASKTGSVHTLIWHQSWRRNYNQETRF